MKARTVYLYQLSFHYTEIVAFELFEGEKIVAVNQSGVYRIVWIEGTLKSKLHRYPR